MNRYIERLYYRLPFFVQNLAVTLYGLKLSLERFSRESEAYLEALKRTEFLDKNALVEFQKKRFLSLAHHAIDTVPYYKEFFHKEGLSKEDIRSIEDIEKFPVIDKSELKRDPSRFISSKYEQDKLIKLHTSGTTGTPLTIFCTRSERTHHYAFFTRLRSWFGLTSRSKRATFFGRIIMKPENDKPPFWRYDFFQNNLLFSAYHMSSSNLPAYYWKLQNYKPKEVIGYPSCLYELAKFIVDNNYRPLQPELVICTAERLFQNQRMLIEKAFRCPLVNQYGCTEMAFFASECEHGSMHFHPEHGIVETVSDATESHGRSGSLVCTGLLNFSMPLIRYRIGDRITMEKDTEGCPCGRAFDVIKEIEGREDDILYQLDGTPVTRLDPIFKGGLGIQLAQVRQDRAGDLIISVVSDGSFDDQCERALIYETKKRFGEDIPVSVLRVASIPKTATGKFKAVIGEFDPSSQW